MFFTKIVFDWNVLQNQLFSKINIPESAVLAIDSSLPVAECAEDYARKLKQVRMTNGGETFRHFFSRIVFFWMFCLCLDREMKNTTGNSKSWRESRGRIGLL